MNAFLLGIVVGVGLAFFGIALYVEIKARRKAMALNGAFERFLEGGDFVFKGEGCETVHIVVDVEGKTPRERLQELINRLEGMKHGRG